MRISFREPTAPRYIYVDPDNRVHVMVPLVGGEEIGTDNTCQTVAALQQFFGKDAQAVTNKKSVLDELKRYKRALEYDISMMNGASEIKTQKQRRLEQIEQYITAITSAQNRPQMDGLRGYFPDYPEVMKSLLREQVTNLYGMVLRPRHPDGFLRTQSPIFSVNRDDPSPQNSFYQSLVNGFNGFAIPTHQGPRERLIAAVLAGQTAAVNVEALQRKLAEKTRELFGVDVDFTHYEGTPIDRAYINAVMVYDETTPPADYVDALLNMCASNLWDTLPVSPFSSVPNTNDGKEKLSILTQFFLGQINIYCHAHGLSAANFGAVLDGNAQLSRQLVTKVKEALTSGASVETTLLKFVNDNRAAFGLARPLSQEASDQITKRFNREYITIKDSPHFDEFMVLYNDKPGDFRAHQGAICVDFSKIVGRQGFEDLNNDYFRAVATSSNTLPPTVPHKNEAVRAGFEIADAEFAGNFINLIQNRANLDTAVELLLSDTDDNQKVFELLDDATVATIKQSPNWQALLGRLGSHVTNNTIQRAFNAKFMGAQEQLTLTFDMARSLYVGGVQRIKPTDCPGFETAGELRRLLANVYNIMDIDSVEDRITGGFTITCSASTATLIRQLVSANTNKFYLSPDIAKSIYKEVQKQCSPDDYAAMDRLNNGGQTPRKLIKALELLAINVQNIGFPQGGYEGYILTAPSDVLAQIDNIHQFHARFHLTPAIAGRLYEQVNSLGERERGEIARLSNDPAAAKIRRTLELLNLPVDNLDFNGTDGYWLSASPAVLGHIKQIAQGERPTQFTRERRTFDFEVSPDEARAGFLMRVMDLTLEEARAAVAAERAQQEQTPQPQRRMPLAAEAETPRIRRVAPTAPVIPATQNQITVERVAAFRSLPISGNAAQVSLNCSAEILQSFRNLLRGTPILGCSFVNPYTNQVETLPTNVDQLTARHLHLLARNEHVNTTGVMKTHLYQGKLSDDQIARLRCLVKATTVAGVTNATHTGGYHSQRVPLTPVQKTIVIDQSGLQWQGDFRNTGGMFFYPNNTAVAQLPHGYQDWQREMYQSMYRVPRPVAPGRGVDVSWMGVAGRLDLDGVKGAIEQEFLQALSAAVQQGNTVLADNERINFKFLKAGMGFFAAGLYGQHQQTLEIARLEGIEAGLLRIAQLPAEQRAALLGKVQRVELPFSGGAHEQAVVARIGAIVTQLGLQWGGAPNEDALAPRTGYVNATTNCGDPHAMIGNEGGFSSVDAAISVNALLDHLNAAYNPGMQLTVSNLYGMQQSLNVTADAGVAESDDGFVSPGIKEQIVNALQAYIDSRGVAMRGTDNELTFTPSGGRSLFREVDITQQKVALALGLIEKFRAPDITTSYIERELAETRVADKRLQNARKGFHWPFTKSRFDETLVTVGKILHPESPTQTRRPD